MIDHKMCRLCRRIYKAPPSELPYFEPEYECCPHAKGYDPELHGAQGVQGPYYRDEGFLQRSGSCWLQNLSMEERTALVLSDYSIDFQGPQGLKGNGGV